MLTTSSVVIDHAGVSASVAGPDTRGEGDREYERIMGKGG
jgi:hypothetical protein